MSTTKETTNGNGKSQEKEKVPVPPRTRLIVLMARNSLIAFGGWLAMMAGNNLPAVTWTDWGGLIVLVGGAALSSFLDYTSGSWAAATKGTGTGDSVTTVTVEQQPPTVTVENKLPTTEIKTE